MACLQWPQHRPYDPIFIAEFESEKLQAQKVYGSTLTHHV